MTDKHAIYIFPTIVIITNDMFLGVPNIAIQAHWLWLHFRWRWIKERRHG